MEYLKTWKEQKISRGELEDLWEQNIDYEVAEKLLLVLRDAEDISLKHKVSFLTNLISDYNPKNFGDLPESIRMEVDHRIHWPRAHQIRAEAFQIFLELVPEWNDEFEYQCRGIIDYLGWPAFGEADRKGYEGKIKKFVHSYLNTHKKEEMDEHGIAKALVNNRMFEELVNYDFVSHTAVNALWKYVFGQEIHGLYGSGIDIAGKLSKAWKKSQDSQTRHALSVIHYLLAKRGDLEKIFQVEK